MTLPFCMPSDHRVAGAQRWGRVQGVTLAPIGQTRGLREFLCFRPGFYVAMGRLVHAGDRCDAYPSGDFFKLHFRLSGQSRVAQAHAPGSQRIAAGSVTTLVQPRDSFKEEFFAAGEQERSVTVCCARSFLADELGLAAGDSAPQALAGYLHGAGGRFELQQSPMSPAQQALADALLDSAPTDPYRALFAEAKAVELLHSFLAQPPAAAASASGRAEAASQRVAAVRRYIDEHLGLPLDMPGLARRFGLSESRLARSFRAACGLPISDYIGRARLQRAHGLLQEGRLNVTEVAFEVGYSHVANFSTAFKRCFGTSPQALRKAARAGGVSPRPAASA